jgi:hypothetical protein
MVPWARDFVAVFAVGVAVQPVPGQQVIAELNSIQTGALSYSGEVYYLALVPGRQLMGPPKEQGDLQHGRAENVAARTARNLQARYSRTAVGLGPLRIGLGTKWT